MLKLNKLGTELLEYKEEMQKDYSPLIKRSLQFSIDELANNQIIDVDIHYSLKDVNCSLEDLEKLLLEKKKCLKTQEELFKEYEVLRIALNDSLRKEITFSESVVEEEIVKIYLSFSLTKEFIKNFFLIESEEEFKKILQMQGFAHKFALLRLEKIMKDFFEHFSFESINNSLKCKYSPVFFHEKKEVYGIQIVISCDINALEDEDSFNQIVENIDLLNEESNTFYKNKMIY